MRPRNVLFFLFACLGSFLTLGFFFPGGMQLGTFNVRFFKIEFASAQDSVPSANPVVKPSNLQHLQKQAEMLADADSTATLTENMPEFEIETETTDADFKIDSGSAIQYPAGDTTILRSFFRRLDSARAKGELVRILHIGDSQIEGDRISGYVRQRLQQRFGGCGPGLVPMAEEMPSRLYLKMAGIEKTRKYQLLGTGQRGVHNQYSLMHHYFRLREDSANPGQCKSKFFWKLNRLGFKRNSYFQQAGMLFRNQKEPLVVQQNGKSQRFLPSDSLRIVSWSPAAEAGNEFSLSLASGRNTDLFGLCLDCKSGVALDNIPLRGSSGIELLKIKPSFLLEQIRRLNTGLIILQFGVNVVPYEAPSYRWYENNLVKIIQLLKKSSPDIQVLVIGVSDMARKKDGNWMSYDNIPAIIDAQRRACARTNSAFWDMQQVMGGKNSIIAWSKTNPPLAGKDMVHLTPKGAQVMGEFLYRAMSREIRTK